MVRIMPVNRVRCVCDAVPVPAVEVSTVCDACEVGDGGDERWLLGSTVHEIREGHLNGSSGAVERGDRVGSFGGLLRIGRGEGLGL